MGFSKMERKKENMLRAGMKNITKKKIRTLFVGHKVLHVSTRANLVMTFFKTFLSELSV